MSLFRGTCGLTGLLIRAAVICFTFDVVVGVDTSWFACSCQLLGNEEASASS